MTVDRHHGHQDILADNHAFSGTTRQYQHRLEWAPGLPLDGGRIECFLREEIQNACGRMRRLA
jgi:hypothetical protein